MTYTLILSAEARAEAAEAMLYYDEINPDLGLRFLSEVTNTYRKLIINPQFYKYIRNKRSRLRCARVTRFPFLIIYYINKAEIIVVSVQNTNRKNKYK